MDQRDCDNNDEAAHTTAKCMTYLLEVGEPEGKPDEKSEAEATEMQQLCLPLPVQSLYHNRR